MNDFDYVKMSCPACGTESPFSAFCETPVSGELPHGDYQCPVCKHAFRRARQEPTHLNQWKSIRLEPIASVL